MRVAILAWGIESHLGSRLPKSTRDSLSQILVKRRHSGNFPRVNTDGRSVKPSLTMPALLAVCQMRPVLQRVTQSGRMQRRKRGCDARQVTSCLLKNKKKIKNNDPTLDLTVTDVSLLEWGSGRHLNDVQPPVDDADGPFSRLRSAQFVSPWKKFCATYT